jgi:hypothetical protein
MSTGNRYFECYTPDFVLSSPIGISSVHRQFVLASGFCTLCCGWAKQVGQLFCGLFEGLSKKEEGHHHHPVPLSSDDASTAAATMTTLAAIGGKGFAACSWVDLTLVHTHPTPRQRQRGSYDDKGNAGTRDGNNGGNNSGWWTARLATGAGGRRK